MKERTTIFKCCGCCASDFMETEDWQIFTCPKCGWQLKLIETLNLFPSHEGKGVKPLSEYLRGHAGHSK